MLKINKIEFSETGNRINYLYSYNKNISRFFNRSAPFYCQYDIDVSRVSKSIAIIPFLANIAPIAWFAGFSIELDEVDETFFHSLEFLKNEFRACYPNVDFSRSEIKVEKLIKNEYRASKSAMLFSGGVDAYATFFRHYNEKPDLITIHGADIEIEDVKQWNRVVQLNENEVLLKNNLKHYIKSNLRTFYTHHVDLLLPDLGWWGKVQHGLALNGVTAPISVVNNYQINYIASSYTDKIDISWGSTPTIDNRIKWGKTSVIHDGYDLKRQDKIDLIVKSIQGLNIPTNLRVCYSLLNRNVNCSKCEKCHRTIIAIILNNDNPNNYGFNVDESVYDEVLNALEKGFSSEGVQYFWWEIYEKIEHNKNIFMFRNKEFESQKMLQVKNSIKRNINFGLQKPSSINKIKFKIQNEFPKIFKIYLKIRQRKL